MVAWERIVDDLIAGIESIRDGTVFGHMSQGASRIILAALSSDRRIETLYRGIGHKVYEKKTSKGHLKSDAELESLIEEIRQMIIDRDLILSEINDLE